MDVDNRRVVIHLVCGARPNFMKVAPLYHALLAEPLGRAGHRAHRPALRRQHVGGRSSTSLGLPEPARHHLGVGSGTHAEQTAKVMMAYEKVLQEQRPDLVVVVGDVNSTMAATLAAAKLGIKVGAPRGRPAHRATAACPRRSTAWSPTSLADMLWAPSQDGDRQPARARASPRSGSSCVGNIMIDSLEMCRAAHRAARMPSARSARPGAATRVVTLHRPSNVDDPAVLARACATMLERVSASIPLVFPVHPRTRQRIAAAGLLAKAQDAGPYLHAGAARLHRVHESRLQRPPRHHRLRRHPGGDHLSRHPLPDDAGEHRAAGHRHARHEPAVRARRAAGHGLPKS